MIDRFTIVLVGRPSTMNAALRQHLHENRGASRAVRGEAKILTRQAVKGLVCRWIGVEVTSAYPNARSLPDVAAEMPTIKAAIDGIRDAGVIPDDDAKHMRWLVFHAPLVDRSLRIAQTSVTVHIEPEEMPWQ